MSLSSRMSGRTVAVGLTAVALAVPLTAPAVATQLNQGTAIAASGAQAAPAQLTPAASTAASVRRARLAMACRPVSRSRGLKAWPAGVRARIMTQFRVKQVGGYRPGGGRSDHHRGMALDVMVGRNKTLGNRVTRWAIGNHRALKLKYVIWYQRIWIPGQGWRKMSNRGSATANHKDHPHLSFKAGRGRCPAA